MAGSECGLRAYYQRHTPDANEFNRLTITLVFHKCYWIMVMPRCALSIVMFELMFLEQKPLNFFRGGGVRVPGDSFVMISLNNAD